MTSSDLTIRSDSAAFRLAGQKQYNCNTQGQSDLTLANTYDLRRLTVVFYLNLVSPCSVGHLTG